MDDENEKTGYELFACPAHLTFTSSSVDILKTEKYNKETKGVETKEQLTENVLDLFNINEKLGGDVVRVIEGAFYQNNTIEALALPDNVNEIKDQAFNGCDNLKYLTVPYSLSTYGVAIMVSCKNFTAYVVDKRSEKATNETNWVTVGDITYYPLSAFSVGSRGVLYDKAYEVMYSVPAQYVPANDEGELKTYDNIRMIHSCCFRNTQNIEKVILSQGIMAVPHQCFLNSKVKSIVIPNSVVQFGQDMFQGCI